MTVHDLSNILRGRHTEGPPPGNGEKAAAKGKKSLSPIDFIIFIILPLLIGMFMYAWMSASLHSYMESLVEKQALLLEQLASQRIRSRKDELKSVTEYLRDGRVAESEMGAAVGRLLDNPTQINIGILRQDGTPVSGHPLRSSEYPAIQAAFRGNSTVRYRRGEGLLFTSPIYNNGEVRYALYEFFDEKAMFDSFTDEFFRDQGEIMIADVEQHIIMPFSGSRTEKDAYFSQPSVIKAFSKLEENMKTSKVAAIYRKGDGSEDFIFVVNMEEKNMYLVGILPHKVVAEGITNLSDLVLIVFAIVILLLMLGTFRVVNANAKARESDALREAKLAAEEASKAKSNFLANMSHELRTPINAIMGFNEMILREADDHLTRERALDVQSAAQILLGLINDVLDFSKIESGNLNILNSEYSLPLLIRDLALLSENRARAKSLDFEIAIQPNLPIGLYGDDSRLRQVLTNLLTNAVKYTPRGIVTLKISGDRKDAETECLHFEVIDTGTGIKPENLEKMFLPYSRVEEHRNRNVEGTGLGLAIVINLLRLMGSELQVKSDYGKGSNFHFDLDQKIMNHEPVGDIHERLSNMVQEYKHRVNFTAPQAKILMVDDNSMNRKIFENLLKPIKSQIKTVSSGQKCLECVQKEHYDIIFMDHLMPEMDGVETLQRLNTLEGNLCSGSPVIALTANAFTGAEESYRSMGFDGFLPKPIATDKLKNLIRNLLPSEYLESAPEDVRTVVSTPAPVSEDLPEIEGVNWEYATLRISDTKLLMDTLKDYYHSIDNEYREISKLAEHVDTEDGLANYRTRVHALKSTSAMVGILSVSEIAKLLEAAAMEGETGKISVMTPVLLEELIKFRERIKPVVDETVSLGSGDPALLAARLGLLSAAMTEMNIGEADEIMRQINSYSYEPDVQTEVDQLGALAESLNYDDALELIKKLKASIESSFT